MTTSKPNHILVETAPFENAHGGKKPRGLGYYMFDLGGSYPIVKGRGMYSVIKAKALAIAKDLNVVTIYVMP